MRVLKIKRFVLVEELSSSQRAGSQHQGSDCIWDGDRSLIGLRCSGNHQFTIMPGILPGMSS